MDLDHTITGIVVFMSFQSKIGSSITHVLCRCVYVCVLCISCCVCYEVLHHMCSKIQASS